MTTTSWKLCPACEKDPDPRGPSACFTCRELNRTRAEPPLVSAHVAGLARALDDYVVDIRLGQSSALSELALDGAVAAYYQAEKLGDRPSLSLDFTIGHVDRVARRLFRAFDDASQGKEPLHEFDVMAQCEHDGRFVVDNWRALARAAIRLGAIVPAEEEVQS